MRESDRQKAIAGLELDAAELQAIANHGPSEKHLLTYLAGKTVKVEECSSKVVAAKRSKELRDKLVGVWSPEENRQLFMCAG